MTGLTLWVTQMFAWSKHQRRSKHCGNGHQRLLLHGGSEAALAAPIHHRFRDQRYAARPKVAPVSISDYYTAAPNVLLMEDSRSR